MPQVLNFVRTVAPFSLLINFQVPNPSKGLILSYISFLYNVWMQITRCRLHNTNFTKEITQSTRQIRKSNTNDEMLYQISKQGSFALLTQHQPDSILSPGHLAACLLVCLFQLVQYFNSHRVKTTAPTRSFFCQPGSDRHTDRQTRWTDPLQGVPCWLW